MPNSGMTVEERLLEVEKTQARLSERTHQQANQQGSQQAIAASLQRIESSVTNPKKQASEMAESSPPAKQPASNTAIIAMAASGVGIIIGCATIGTLIFNIGGSIREMQVMQNGLTAALARLESGVNTGREQRERDVNRLEGLIKGLDVEQRAQGSRLTRQEVIQGLQRGVPQSLDDTTLPARGGVTSQQISARAVLDFNAPN